VKHKLSEKPLFERNSDWQFIYFSEWDMETFISKSENQ
jgi:hypothetical protein